MEDMPALKPCPHCGAEGVIDIGSDGSSQATCAKRCVSLWYPDYPTAKVKAAEAWNKRTADGASLLWIIYRCVARAIETDQEIQFGVGATVLEAARRAQETFDAIKRLEPLDCWPRVKDWHIEAVCINNNERSVTRGSRWGEIPGDDELTKLEAWRPRLGDQRPNTQSAAGYTNPPADTECCPSRFDSSMRSAVMSCNVCAVHQVGPSQPGICDCCARKLHKA